MKKKDVESILNGKRHRKIHTPLELVIIYGFIGLFMLLVLIPFIVLVCSSFSDSALIRANGARPWVQGFSLDAYQVVFKYPEEMLHSYLVSIIITIAGTILNTVLCAMVAYATARPIFKFRRIVTFFFTFTIMFQAGFIPNYIWYRNFLNIYDTYWVLILTPAFVVGHMVLLRAFYSGISPSLYEAVKIDGGSEFTIFFKISTPLILPGIATVLFYSVLVYWNDSFTALLYTDNFTPVSLYLTRVTQYIEFLKYAQQVGIGGLDFSNMQLPDDTILYAIAVATTAPMLCIFAVFQRFFVGGLTAGAIKE